MVRRQGTCLSGQSAEKRNTCHRNVPEVHRSHERVVLDIHNKVNDVGVNCLYWHILVAGHMGLLVVLDHSRGHG
jgi:hypothetical protein